jgi:hypothetical protein
MLKPGDEIFWETNEYALLKNALPGEILMLYNLRLELASYFDETERFEEICTNMAAHRRPLLDAEQLEQEHAALNTVPTRMQDILDRLLERSVKAKDVNPIWQEAWERRDLILDETWKEHSSKLARLGNCVTPEIESQALYDLRRTRDPLLAALRREYLDRLSRPVE